METTRSRSAAGARRLLRIFLPAVLIIAWVAGAAIGGPLFGKVEEVSSNDQTSYLPESADATAVQQRLGDFLGSDAIPAIVVFGSGELIDDSLREHLQTGLSAATEDTGVFGDASPVLVSEDERAAQAFVPIDSGVSVPDAVEALTASLRETVPDGVEVFVTGPAGFTADLVAGFAGIDGLLLGVALLAVFIILVFVYRSVVLPVVVLSTSVFALCVALAVVWFLAKAEVLLLSGQTQGILFILVIGAATDYSLLMVARFREELRLTEDRGLAIRRSLRGTIEPILASGGTVIAGLLCLLLSDLKSNSTLGPVASIGIVFAMLSALTLLPALLFIIGRPVFWPRRPVYAEDAVRDEGEPGVWNRIADIVRRRPRLIWVVTTVALAVAALGVTQLNAQGVAQSELVRGQSDARDGQVLLGEHFPAGSGSPAYVLIPEPGWRDAAEIALAHDGVDGVAVTSADSPSGSAPVTADGIAAVGPPGTVPPEPSVDDGDVLLQLTLTDAPDSDGAADTVRSLRSELAPLGGAVGGVTATAVDTNAASIADRTLIIPIVLVVILLILMVLLRAVLLPLLLILTTVLSFGSAMGVAALLFNGVFGFPGADPAVPLYGFIFLVALGIDYNIFLMTRVREETLHHGTREGTLRGLRVTGGVITSAGVVLAATFAALSVIPILFLIQIAFIVAFGVLLDTFIVRSLLVPALAYDLGRVIWWPSRLAARLTPERSLR